MKKKNKFLILFVMMMLCFFNFYVYATNTEHKHNYNILAKSVNGTCSSSGYEVWQCSCGNGNTKWLGKAPNNHSALSNSVTKAATCTEAGATALTCLDCNVTVSTGTIAKLGHDYNWTGRTDPTCTANGANYYACSRCTSTTSSSIAALGHEYGDYQTNYDDHWRVCWRCSDVAYYGAHYDNDNGLCNTCNYRMYYAPTAPTITVKDTAGNVITSEWINKDLKISVGGSTMTSGARGSIAYSYNYNNGSYTAYSTPLDYKLINTNTTFYAKAYNSDGPHMYNVSTRVLPKIEKEKPTFSISIDSTEYEKSHTATLTFKDTGGSKLKADTYTVSYTWTDSATTPSSYAHTTTVTTTKADSKTATITKSDGTGIYYLHVKLDKKIKDNATNECDTTTLSIAFYMDNTAPVISQKEIQTNPVALNKNATYSMDFQVLEEHSGLVTSSFTTSDIVVKVNGVTSTATKTLTYKSKSNNLYEYTLTITNVTETGQISLTINANGIEDEATNKSAVTNFALTVKNGEDYVGPYADNWIPVISIPDEVTRVTVEVDKNLSGVIDKRYVNQYYTIEIPIRILDIGGQDFTEIVEEEDLIIRAGNIDLTPSIKVVTLKSEDTTPDTPTKLNVYQKDYILTLSGLLEDGDLTVTAIMGAIEDLAGNINVETKMVPYTNETGLSVQLFVDNTKPQPTIKSVSSPDSVKGTTTIRVEMFIKDLGSGIRIDQFEVEDMDFQIDGARIASVTKNLVGSPSNNHNTRLGIENASNYTYTLTLTDIEENGMLRIQIVNNNIIDKANNGNDSVTLDVNTIIDNTGPKLGPITTNADKNGEVFNEVVEVKITECSDPSGIARYEWQRSEDGINFETIYIEDSVLSTSDIEDSLNTEKRYYYRVIVSDTLGNTSTSEIAEIKYRNTLDGKPTIRLEKEQTSSTLIKINAVIKSKSPIVKIKINDSELPKEQYENNVKINNYEITTTFNWEVTQNGVYEVTVEDEKGNVAVERINVSEFDFTESQINVEKKDATSITPAQIIFTSNEPIRIKVKSAYPGITFEPENFGTRIVASVSSDVDFKETKIFEFENKGLTPISVPVEPPLITKFAYLRFSKISVGNLNMTIAEIEALVKNMPTTKFVLSTGQVKSYYGFKTENIDTKIATQIDLNTAENLGNISEAYRIGENGQVEQITKNEKIIKSENGNYTTGNMSGMYEKTSGLLDSYSDTMMNDTTTKYNKFRMIIVP